LSSPISAYPTCLNPNVTLHQDLIPLARLSHQPLFWPISFAWFFFPGSGKQIQQHNAALLCARLRFRTKMISPHALTGNKHHQRNIILYHLFSHKPRLTLLGSSD
jgi:hypothetical protein